MLAFKLAVVFGVARTPLKCARPWADRRQATGRLCCRANSNWGISLYGWRSMRTCRDTDRNTEMSSMANASRAHDSRFRTVAGGYESWSDRRLADCQSATSASKCYCAQFDIHLHSAEQWRIMRRTANAEAEAEGERCGRVEEWKSGRVTERENVGGGENERFRAATPNWWTPAAHTTTHTRKIRPTHSRAVDVF